jgi:long-subunit acyl-CoA synthetase (AMP-forming)
MSERPRSLLEGIYHYEKVKADKPWLTQPVGGGAIKEFTWKTGVGEIRRMAAYLKSLNLPPGSSIAMLTKNAAWFFLADAAIWMAGHVSVPMYPTISASTINQILTHSESRLLFVGKLDGWASQAAGVPKGIQKVVMPLGPPIDAPKWDELVAKHEPLGDVLRKPDELATLTYTSGSTGEPKGVMITFGAMAASVLALLESIPHREGDRGFSHLPLAHAAERWLIECSSMMTGNQIFFAESLDTFVEDLKRARPTMFFTVPRLWQKFQLGVFSKMPAQKIDRLLKIPIISSIVRKKILKGLGLDTVRVAASGAAPIPPELMAWYRRLGLELLEGYGMTENFACSHASLPGRVRVGYVGEPYPGVRCRISEEGEIQVQSPGMMKGYYKAPELTAEVFTADGWLKTGDRGEVDELGRLRITGRVKELFKTSKGKYIAPVPIEGLLGNHPAIEAVCVGGLGRPQPYGLVMLGPEARKKAQGGRGDVENALKQHLETINAELEDHEKLAFVSVVRDEWQVENGFLTPSLKIRRMAIEKAYEPHLDAWYQASRPVVWQEA